MTADALLARLEGVKQSGEGRWRARCPACGSHSAALSIRETDNGTVLLHCFRFECDPLAITSAVGLDISDLFAPPVGGVYASPPIGRRFRASDVLAALNIELLETLIVIGAVLRRGAVTPTEYQRLLLSVSRISVAEGYCDA
jgi:hypothetical protein